eukprot:2900583-Ditylum_brightwellii.AAC.1
MCIRDRSATAYVPPLVVTRMGRMHQQGGCEIVEQSVVAKLGQWCTYTLDRHGTKAFYFAFV